MSTALFDRVQRALFEKGQPKNSIRLTLNHAIGNLNTNLHASRFGKFTVYQPAVSGAQDQTFGEQWVTDASIGYILRGVGITLGANNIFDTYPDTLISANQTRGIYMFSGQSPAGFNGRFLYVKATLDATSLGSFGRRAAKKSSSANHTGAPLAILPLIPAARVADATGVCQRRDPLAKTAC